MTEEEKGVLIEKTKNKLEVLRDSLYRKIFESPGDSDHYFSFLEDVISFLDWTDVKYDYRYKGNNNRVVTKGEIYYCDLGENIGSEQSKNRPVIVLQNDTGNRFAPTTIIAPITNTPKKLPVHLPLQNVQTGLTTSGVIRFEHIRAISKCRLGVMIEKIDPKSVGWKQVESAIKKSLDFK